MEDQPLVADAQPHAERGGELVAEGVGVVAQQPEVGEAEEREAEAQRLKRGEKYGLGVEDRTVRAHEVLAQRPKAVFGGEAHGLVTARAAVPALGVVERQELTDAVAAEDEEVREPPQVDVRGAAAPDSGRGVDVAADGCRARQVARTREAAAHDPRTHIDPVVEFTPRVAAGELGAVSRGEVLADAEAVHEVRGVELLAVETQPHEQVVRVVEEGVVRGRHLGAPAVARTEVTPREEDARCDGGQVARASDPCVDRLHAHQPRGVAIDEVALLLQAVVLRADFVVGGADELLVQPHAQLRFVEVAARREVRRVECSQQVGDLVLDDAPAESEVAAIEIGVQLQFVARAEDVGVVDSEHRVSAPPERGVGTDGPAVARAHHDVYHGGVLRIGYQLDGRIGEVVARAQQLLVADQERGVHTVAGAEQQVAPHDPLVRERMGVVARAFEPVAVRIEDLCPSDVDASHGAARIGRVEAALVDHASAGRGVDRGAPEEELVEHARHGPAAALGLDAVVESEVVFAQDVDAVLRSVASGQTLRASVCGAYAVEVGQPRAVCSRTIRRGNLRRPLQLRPCGRAVRCGVGCPRGGMLGRRLCG